MLEPKVYYRGVFSYQRRSYLVVGLIIGAIGVPGLISFIRYLLTNPQEWSWSNLGFFLFATIFTGGFAWLGCGLCYHHWKQTKWEVTIDDTGVRRETTAMFGKFFLPWSKIGYFGVGSIRGKDTLLYVIPRGRLVREHFLEVSPGMTRSEGEELVRNVQRDVSPIHPEIHFSDNRVHEPTI